jgi:hypothetical protein
MGSLSRSEAIRYLRAVLGDFAKATQDDGRRYYRLFDLALFRMAREGVIPKERWNDITSRAGTSTPALVLDG